MSNLIGKSAPTFPVLKDQDGADFDISSVIGKEPCVIFFYPQAMTYGP
jgi:peroxiredoxin